jgi:hypothetical protein
MKPMTEVDLGVADRPLPDLVVPGSPEELVSRGREHEKGFPTWGFDGADRVSRGGIEHAYRAGGLAECDRVSRLVGRDLPGESASLHRLLPKPATRRDVEE